MQAFSSFREQGCYLWYLSFSLQWPLFLQRMGSRCTGSVVVAHGLSCYKACGIFPDQGLNLCLLHWQVASHPLYHQGSPTISLLCSPFSMPQSFYSFPNREFSSLCFLVTFSTIRGGDRGGHRERCLLELLIKLNFANQKATSPRGKLYHCL